MTKIHPPGTSPGAIKPPRVLFGNSSLDPVTSSIYLTCDWSNPPKHYPLQSLRGGEPQTGQTQAFFQISHSFIARSQHARCHEALPVLPLKSGL